MFSHDPPTGVYTGITPSANSHRTNAGVLCPARLSSTNRIRNGGRWSGRVIGTLSPTCHRSHAARDASAVGGGAGSSATMVDSSRVIYRWRTALVTKVAASTRTRPSDGRNRVNTLAV